MALPPIVAVVGPTAAGKTGLSLDLAEQLGGEVVNTDAMQLYRGMDVGTATLPPAERRGLPHHLLDLLDVTEPANVAAFQVLARDTIAEVRARGAVPVLVGGSALYTRAVLDRFEFPGTEPAVRARWERRLDEVGAPALHAELAVLDPAAAVTIEPANGRRVVRALEVGELTGRSYTATLPEMTYVDPATVQVGLAIDRPVLDDRIARRVEQMYDAGLLDEVRRLLDQGLREGLTASRAIGYREAAAHLAGELTREEAVERTVFATRRFARRQMGWWRKDPRITWVEHDDPDRLAVALDAVAAATVGP
ncbi:tRNA (adenosine(37)-N6)-dimethylallyltransferase MiaA [Nocardioides sp. AX2bis]|uniref:tRNA (adenosine(37)-N6)-dimethylallyltransferase MiaA n=1 Tax=Nocardioides sp. AX2bis TaxID=2653157 RepID=UPI00135C5A78|nr:tRNA (adenosine(37)-N6)-dimethylallyltransferase MiaA [Nocardioides sp. AX2bis]